MRRIPVLAVIKESYKSTFLDNAYFLNVGWQTLGVLIASSIAIDILDMLGVSSNWYVGMMFAMIVIPYVIACYQFTVDGIIAPSPKLFSLANAQPHYKQIHKTFIKNYLAVNFIVGIVLAAGFVMLFIPDNRLQTRLIGLALIPGSFILWLALSFTMPASATGRDTSITTSAKQLWGNYLRYLFVILTACIPFVALVVGIIAGSVYLDDMVPAQALIIMTGVMACVALMILSTPCSPSPWARPIARSSVPPTNAPRPTKPAHPSIPNETRAPGTPPGPLLAAFDSAPAVVQPPRSALRNALPGPGSGPIQQA